MESSQNSSQSGLTALDFALADSALPVRETNGPNRSPEIDAMNTFVGIPLGSPYCAAGVSYCFHRAGATSEQFPFSGGSQAIRQWFEERGLLTFDPSELKYWKGALFGWSLDDGHGHIGFVSGRLVNASGEVVGIQTCEYNTDKAGSREGEGCYQLRRSFAGPHRLWFCNCSDIHGGDWNQWCSTLSGSTPPLSDR